MGQTRQSNPVKRIRPTSCLCPTVTVSPREVAEEGWWHSSATQYHRLRNTHVRRRIRLLLGPVYAGPGSKCITRASERAGGSRSLGALFVGDVPRRSNCFFSSVLPAPFLAPFSDAYICMEGLELPMISWRINAVNRPEIILSGSRGGHGCKCQCAITLAGTAVLQRCPAPTGPPAFPYLGQPRDSCRTPERRESTVQYTAPG